MGFGLLDATTDSVYLATEDFESWEYKMAAAAAMSLPIVMVLLSFWAIVFIDYKHKKWRYIPLPIDGPLKLVLLIYASLTAFSWGTATVTTRATYVMHRFIASKNSLTRFFSKLYKQAYVDTKATIKTKLVGNRPEEVTVTSKFYHGGLTNLLLVSCKPGWRACSVRGHNYYCTCSMVLARFIMCLFERV